MFMFGRDCWGKKQPEFTYYLAVILSNDPITSTLPSGSRMNEMLGLAIYWLRQVGAASMIPPTRQKDAMYSCQFRKSEGMATCAFLGRYFASIGLMCSTKSIPGSICFFFSCWRGGIWSIFKWACPLPLNSSSILKIQVETYKFLEISWASENINSDSS